MCATDLQMSVCSFIYALKALLPDFLDTQVQSMSVTLGSLLSHLLKEQVQLLAERIVPLGFALTFPVNGCLLVFCNCDFARD